MNEHASIMESLVNSPGWALFAAHIEREWGLTGVQYQQQLDRALNDRNIDHACQIRSGQKVIATLMRWPHEELTRLKRQAQPEVEEVKMSRRGTL